MSIVLIRLLLLFGGLSMLAFGGGLAAWTRREIVEERGWLDDRQFLSGYALSQLIPGATNVNLAVFIGAQMRGLAGAIACFLGLTAPPVLLTLVIGYFYLHSQNHAAGAWVGPVLAGMGAVAIGLSLGTGVRLGLRNIRGFIPIVVMTVVSLSVGVFDYSLVHVLLVMMPLSLLLAWATRTR